MSEIYLVIRSSGEYDDFYELPIIAFKDKCMADDHIEKCVSALEEMKVKYTEATKEHKKLLDPLHKKFNSRKKLSRKEEDKLFDDMGKLHLECKEKQVAILESNPYDPKCDDFKADYHVEPIKFINH